MFETEDAFLNSHSRFSPALPQRLSVLILLLAVALMTTSCGMPAQAAGTQNTQNAQNRQNRQNRRITNNLNLSGNLPLGTVNESYNAVLAVGGGSPPYHFSVKAGTLPPGISLNQATGTFSGMPSTAGTFSFEVIVTDSPRLDQGSQTFVVAIDGGNGGTVNVGVSPASATLSSNQKQQFTAAVSGTSNTGVTWSAAAGSVDANGLYTAPAVNAQTSVVVTAASNADSSKSASAAVTVDPVNNQALQITTGTLPQGQQGNTYSEVFTATGGTTPYSWSISAGTPPPGTAMNVNGNFAGMPTTVGTFNFTVTVTDAANKTASQTFVVAIGAGSGGTVNVGVSPASVTLSSSQKQQFTATVSGTSNTGVTWSAAAGSVDANGLYAAPAVNAQTSVVVTAASNADSSKSASAAVTVDPVNNQALQITTGTLPQGQQGNTYSEGFTATGGTTPYSRSISAGTPPPGIAMNVNGDLAGMPTTVGTFNFTVTVTDATNLTATGNFSVTVAAGGNFDGPAELPRVTVPSAMSGTPAPGSVITVNAGGSIQTALNNAVCGQTIQLQAGAVFTGGQITIPNHSCDINHWIIIETSAYSSLPPEGTRLTPCYSGVASLPGRPAYSCSSPSNTTAKIVYNSVGTGIKFAAGASYYRLIGLEITRAGTSSSTLLLSATAGTISDHIIIDRCWFHGNAGDETQGGTSLNNMTNAAIVDSYYSDFHCLAPGSCSDSQAIGGGTGTTQDGPWKIQNNFLESSGEVILIGGGAATQVPTDITVQYNHMFKPLTWMPGIISTITESGTTATITLTHTAPASFAPGQSLWISSSSVAGYTGVQWTMATVAGNVVTFTATAGLGSATGGYAVVQGGDINSGGPGHPFTVKNLFELKTGIRVLLDSNLLENVWGGFGQFGDAILLTPKNPGSPPTCNVCSVTDVTIRYNKLSHVGSGIEIADIVTAGASGGMGVAGERYSIHDLVIDDINKTTYNGFGVAIEELQNTWTGTAPHVLNTVTINHITAFADLNGGGLTEIGNTQYTTNPMYGFVFTNNIVSAGQYPVWSTGGASNCAYNLQTSPLAIFNACFTTYTFTNNALIATGAGYPSSVWPSGNIFPAIPAAVDFVNYNGGNGGDYTLQSSSPYKNAGTDGKDLGADIVGLNAALANVE